MLPWNRQGNKRQANRHLNILQSYAQSPKDVELFLSDSSGSLSFLKFSDVLAAFPSGSVPRQPFKWHSKDWQLRTCTHPGSKQPVHLAVLVSPSSRNKTSSSKLAVHSVSAESSIEDLAGTDTLNRSASSSQPVKSTMSKKQLQLPHEGSLDMYGEEESALQRYSNGASRSENAGRYGSGHNTPNRAHSNGENVSPTPNSNGTGKFSRSSSQRLRDDDGRLQEQEVERKFNRNLVNANRKTESLERYKALVSLIEVSKRRLAALLSDSGVNSLDDIAWWQEPAASLMQSVLDVGEALASFGNCHFPEHSNEGRAILAGDYKALLRRYLSSFGFMFAQPTKEHLPHDLQEDVQTIGSLLATRCEAYNLLYDQLVRHVGLENRGNSTLIVNNNSAAANPHTSITANPTNTTTASANSKSKALNQGMGAAAIAAAGLLGMLVVRAMRGGGGSGGRGGRGKRSKSDAGSAASSSLVQQQKQYRIPKGKGGRELVLVSQLSQCGDELRRAQKNDEALKDDWRLGRHVRLAWPPGPTEPPGYEKLSPDACNVTQLLQEMYG